MSARYGFIFDLDGVITDTAEYHYQAWKRLADEEGVPFTRDDNEALRGVSRRRSLELLLKGRTLPDEQMQAWMTRKNAYYVASLDSISPADLLPGTRAFLDTARARGLAIGLGSASRNAQAVVERLGVHEMFDALGDGASVVRSKPAPDLFVWVAGRLNLSPARCVVFEDAEAGVQAAREGGFRVVGIGPQERVGGADRVVNGLADLTVGAALALLEQPA